MKLSPKMGRIFDRFCMFSNYCERRIKLVVYFNCTGLKKLLQESSHDVIYIVQQPRLNSLTSLQVPEPRTTQSGFVTSD